jgi:hypothetical protein
MYWVKNTSTKSVKIFYSFYDCQAECDNTPDHLTGFSPVVRFNREKTILVGERRVWI